MIKKKKHDRPYKMIIVFHLEKDNTIICIQIEIKKGLVEDN